MANVLPAAVKAAMKASGGPAPVSLFELLTTGGALYTWSDASVSAISVLSTPYGGSTVVRRAQPPLQGEPGVPELPIGNVQPVPFLPWIVKPPVFTEYKSTQTSTFTVSIQNISGDTVRRDAAQIFNNQALLGALVYFRIWRLDCQDSIFDFQGNVDDVDIDAGGDSMDISGEGSFAWSKIQTPSVQIGPSCGNTFGTIECGSTASTPCNNSYGTCTSLERFKGVITEWTGAAISTTQYAQPQPLRLYNPQVPN